MFFRKIKTNVYILFYSLDGSMEGRALRRSPELAPLVILSDANLGAAVKAPPQVSQVTKQPSCR